MMLRGAAYRAYKDAFFAEMDRALAKIRNDYLGVDYRRLIVTSAAELYGGGWA